MVYITYHAEERIRKRKGASKKNALKDAALAFEEGLSHKDITNRNLRNFLNREYLKTGNANNMRIYHRYLYLFSGNVLITVFPLPSNLANIADSIMKRRNASVKGMVECS